jgi:hypothetical protein
VFQAIIDSTGNTWQGFSFLSAKCLASCLVFCLAVDVLKGLQDVECWTLEQRNATAYVVHQDGKDKVSKDNARKAI